MKTLLHWAGACRLPCSWALRRDCARAGGRCFGPFRSSIRRHVHRADAGRRTRISPHARRPERSRRRCKCHADSHRTQADLRDVQGRTHKEMADIKKGLGDVVQTEKVDRINAEITKLQYALDDVNSSASRRFASVAATVRADPDQEGPCHGVQPVLPQGRRSRPA